jgi:sirohydrochlorin ferrochelatase
MSRDHEPRHSEPVGIQLRVARVENRLNEKTREAPELDDAEILAYVRVRRSLHREFHRKVGKVCSPPPPPPPPPPGEHPDDEEDFV